ncbi:DUF4127 family protein [Lapidilactobacillus achengensis]|uniref:DUF4127 family protein n=1 Tax=Lapidilactobacillus achengensis TaxID=2486000 RepID=A0ABW1UNV2_9LACO|nr:DUF4127 family protein [Lapidilactobacillus achengensis]
MKKIIYVPLDERPCNLEYVRRRTMSLEQIEVTVLPREFLGNKKIAGDVVAIRHWLQEMIQTADYLLLSAETLIYGGLLPSRIHHLDQAEIKHYQDFLIAIKQARPELKIYVENLIMRAPRYNSSEEEPEYYQTYGQQIFEFGWLKDKANQETLSIEETDTLLRLREVLPKQVVSDYETRRAFNVRVNFANLKLVESHVIDLLMIPQDDSALYGYTAVDQHEVYGEIRQRRLQQRVLVHPGADEAGYTLLARAIQDIQRRPDKVYVLYASPFGAQIVPLYEDRPLSISVEAHLLAAGCEIVTTSTDADWVLAVNTPGATMQEASAQIIHRDHTYDTYRNSRAFVADITKLLRVGKPVALADSAYANGGDLELLEMLDQTDALVSLKAYRGWNTNCNSVGSTIGEAVLDRHCTQTSSLLWSVLDDGLYQALVRQEIVRKVLPNFGGDAAHLVGQEEFIAQKTVEFLKDEAIKRIPNLYHGQDFIVSFPWHRVFEIEITQLSYGLEYSD